MHKPPASRTRRLALALLAAAALAALAACADVAASLPVRPTPVPTLARLPSVTPVTPRPTPPTPTPGLATPTPEPLTATVAGPANVREGPGVDFGIAGIQAAGDVVTLTGRQGQWYRVRTTAGVVGWIAAQLLEVDPATAAAVPEVSP
jgi:uncharacterized protein YgiM (DUF1202 family)